jgi:Tfp pilus assembly PilM family ATPase
MKWIILDFGTYEIKALRVSLDGPKLIVEDFASFPSKPEYFKGLGFPGESAWTAATIGLNELDWLNPEEDQTIIAALPSAYLEARYIKFPFRNQKKIEKILPFELEAMIPFDIEEIQIRSLLLEGEGVTSAKKDALVLALSYKREPIKSYEAELRKFQLSIPPITSQNLALSSLRQAITDSSVYGILEVGHSKSHFLMIQKSGTILGTRTFWWGGHSMAESLAKEFSIDPSRAKKLLHEMDPTKPVPKSLEESFSQFSADLRQTMKGMVTAGIEFPKPFHIFTLGEASKTPGLVDSMIENLYTDFETSVEAFPKEKLLGRNIQGLQNLGDLEKALPALSIALAQLRTHRGKIPTFSETGFQFQQNLRKIKSGSFSLLRKIAMLLIAPLIYGAFHMAIQNQENQAVLAKFSEILKRAGFKFAPQDSTDDILSKMKKEIAASRRKIDQLNEDKDSPLVILTQISRWIPNQIPVNVKEFRVTSSIISLTAEVPSTEDANQIANALKEKFAKLKMGAVTTCPSKKDCKSFTLEIERETNS